MTPPEAVGTGSDATTAGPSAAVSLVTLRERSDFLRAVHAQDDLVGEPVGPEVHEGGEHEREHQALLAAQHLPEIEEQGAQQAEQRRRLQ